MIATEAIIFSVRPILEKDILVEAFTAKFGLIRLFAKYAQSNKPRFGGRLTTFNHLSLDLIGRSNSFTLKSAMTINSFNQLKQQFNRLAVGYKMIEVIKSVSQHGIENEPLFTLLVKALETLDQSIDPTDHLKEFYYAVLKCEGIISDGMILNEIDYKKMIESYTGIQLNSSL